MPNSTSARSSGPRHSGTRNSGTRNSGTRNPALAGAGLMVLAGALYAVVNNVVQYGTMKLGIAPAQLVFWQYLVALLFAVPWLMRNGATAFRTGQPLLHVLRVALSAAGVQLWTMGLQYVPIWQAIALIMLSPFFVTLGAGLFLGERTGGERWLAVLAGLAGGMIILAPWSQGFNWHALLPVGAAVLWAAVSLMTKHMTHRDSAETLTFYLLLLLTPVNAVVAFGGGFALPHGAAMGLIIAAGVLTAITQYALARAYAIADASYLQPFDQLKLPLNVGLGIAAFGFYPPGAMWIGSALIMGSSLYLLRREAGLGRAEPA